MKAITQYRSMLDIDGSMFVESELVLKPHCRFNQCIFPRCIGEVQDPCGCDTDVQCIEANKVFHQDDDTAPLVEILTPAELLDMGYVEDSST